MDTDFGQATATILREVRSHPWFYIGTAALTILVFHPPESRWRRWSALAITLATWCGILPFAWMLAYEQVAPGTTARLAAHFTGFVVLGALWLPASYHFLGFLLERCQRRHAVLQKTNRPSSGGVRLKLK